MTEGPDSGLRRVRERVGLTQSALARAVGVSPRTVHRWETSNIRSTNPEVSRRVALVLEIDGLATETFGEDASPFFDAPRISLRRRTPREAMVDGDLELVRTQLIRTLEGDWT